MERLKPKDVQAKQELSNALHQATQHTLARLRDLSTSLAHVSGPEQGGLLEKEVVEIEARLQHLLNLLEGRIRDASKQNSAYDALAAQIDSLRKDVDFCKAALLQLLQMEIRPDERLAKTRELGVQVVLNLGKLEALELELGQCEAFYPEDEGMVALTRELEGVRTGLAQVHQDFAIREAESQVALVSWTACQENIVKATPFIEAGALKVSKGFIKPTSLEDAKRLKAEMNVRGKVFTHFLKSG